MSIVQAIILALWYWVTTWYIGYTIGCAMFDDALVTGLVVGIVLGDVPTAMKCAAVIKPMFLAFTGAGGTVVWDQAAADLGRRLRNARQRFGCIAIRYHRCSVEPLVCSVAYHPPYRIHLSGSKS